MEQNFMKEVEQEINRILKKDKQPINKQDFCNEQNFSKCLKQISQEFDYLDVSCMEENLEITNSKSLKNIIIQLINSSYNLIQLQKENQKKQSDAIEKNSRLFSDIKTLTKTVERLQKQNSLKDKQLQQNKDKLCLDEIENNKLKNKMLETKKELNSVHKDISGEKNKYKCQLNKALSETKYLRERFKKNCGEYTSTESHVVSVIDEYKKKEEKYLTMIKQLQENNHLLLEEILTLKGELAVASVKHRTN